ncbi:MAG: DUF2157 domain-containing protein [Nitratireductor sp.]|nr:DUF2157 domain-containing protein [Nitratireductor sp.]MCC0019500.1 DUF2157 domain-containing protein [Nitratireductor sp.]
MPIFGRKTVLRDSIEGWRSSGLIDDTTAETLLLDVETRHPARSFSSIAILLGVICIAFGVVTFVAANWDEMPRILRVAIIGSGLWASWAGSIWARSRNHEWLGQTLILLSCAIFGAGIMLIAQIYNMQGNGRDAVWLWGVGTLAGALLARSVPALSLAVLVFAVWGLMPDYIAGSSKTSVHYAYLFWWVIGAVATWWMRSRFAGHLSALGLVAWTLGSSAIYLSNNSADMLFLLAALACATVLVSALLYSDGAGQWLRGFEPQGIIYSFLLTGSLLFLWYAATEITWYSRSRSGLVVSYWWPGLLALLAAAGFALAATRRANQNRYDLIVAVFFAFVYFVLAGFPYRIPFALEASLLALSVWIIRMGWRLEYHSLSNSGFIGFAAVMLMIYFRTVGSLLSTSLFYTGAGLLILAGAVVLPKLMKRREKAS